jgi:hypothetical protein
MTILRDHTLNLGVHGTGNSSYLMFPMSYRDLELMLADRGVEIAHTTIFRWVQTCAGD